MEPSADPSDTALAAPRRDLPWYFVATLVATGGVAVMIIVTSLLLHGLGLDPRRGSAPVLLAGFAAIQGTAMLAVLVTGRLMLPTRQRLNQMGLAGMTPRRLLWSVLLAPVAVGIVLGAATVVAILAHWFGLRIAPDPLLKMLDPHAPARLATIVFGAVVMAPLGEELFFREALFRSLRQAGRMLNLGGAAANPAPTLAAGVIASAGFALVHQNWHAMIPMFFLGAFLQYVRWRGGTLWMPIVIHAIFNAIMVVSALLFQVPGGP